VGLTVEYLGGHPALPAPETVTLMRAGNTLFIDPAPLRDDSKAVEIRVRDIVGVERSGLAARKEAARGRRPRSAAAWPEESVIVVTVMTHWRSTL
jgi:hypothetical protein